MRERAFQAKGTASAKALRQKQVKVAEHVGKSPGK